MITKEIAHEFAQHWIDAWNSHNLEAILSHYTDDFEMTTPLISTMMNEPSGTLKGKTDIGNYWAKGLSKYPDLKFELIDVLFGINSISIYYRSILNRRAVEVFHFNNEGKVFKAFANYNE